MEKPRFVPRPREKIFVQNAGCDCWKMPQFVGMEQIAGGLYMSGQRVAFIASGLIGTASVSWEIEMKDIVSVRTCTTPPFFSFGVEITTWYGDVYLLGLLNRKKYAAWINEHIS